MKAEKPLCPARLIKQGFLPDWFAGVSELSSAGCCMLTVLINFTADLLTITMLSVLQSLLHVGCCKGNSMRKRYDSDISKKCGVLFVVLILVTVYGCGTSTLMTWQCEQWSYRGSIVNDPDSDYLVKLIGNQCGSKCRCYKKLNDIQFNCEYGNPCNCFIKCAKDWDLECVKWCDVPLTIDFITRERIK
jgi:hypothetical protein